MAGETRGCGDSMCAVERPRALAINGGCRCPAWKLRAEIARLTRELEEAREVLRPFADVAWWLSTQMADETSDLTAAGALTAADFRRARRALATPPADGGGDE